MNQASGVSMPGVSLKSEGSSGDLFVRVVDGVRHYEVRPWVKAAPRQRSVPHSRVGSTSLLAWVDI